MIFPAFLVICSFEGLSQARCTGLSAWLWALTPFVGNLRIIKFCDDLSRFSGDLQFCGAVASALHAAVGLALDLEAQTLCSATLAVDAEAEEVELVGFALVLVAFIFDGVFTRREGFAGGELEAVLSVKSDE